MDLDEESWDSLGEGDGLASSCSSGGGPSWPAASSWQDDDEVHLSMPSSSTTAAKPAPGSLVYVGSDWSNTCMRQLEERLELGRVQLQTQIHRLERRLQLHMTQVIRQQLQPPAPAAKPIAEATVGPGAAHWAELRGEVDSLSDTMQTLLRSGQAEALEMREVGLETPPALAARVDIVAEELARLTGRFDQVEKLVQGGCALGAAHPLHEPPRALSPVQHVDNCGQQLSDLAASVQELEQRWQGAFSRQAQEVEDLYGQVADLHDRLAEGPQTCCFADDAELALEEQPQQLGAEAATDSELVSWQENLQEEMAQTRQLVEELDARTTEMQQSLQHSSLMQDIHHKVVGIGSRILRLRKSSEESATASFELQQVRELVDGVADQVVELAGRMKVAEENSAALAQDVHTAQEMCKTTSLTTSELHKQIQELQAPEVCQSESREQLARLQHRLDELVASSPPAAEHQDLGQQIADLASRMQTTECTLVELKAAEARASEAAAGAAALLGGGPQQAPALAAAGGGAVEQLLQREEASKAESPDSILLGQQVAELASRIHSTECMLQDMKAAEAAEPLGGGRLPLPGEPQTAGALEQLREEQVRDFHVRINEVRAQLTAALDLQQRGQSGAWPDSFRKLEDRLESVAEGLGISMRSLQEKQAGLEGALRDAVVMMYRRADEQVDSLGRQMDRLQRQAHCTVDELKYLNTRQSELASRFTELEHGYQSRCRRPAELVSPDQQQLSGSAPPALCAEVSYPVVKAEPDSKPNVGIPDLRQRVSSLDSQLSRLHSRRQVSWLERSADGL